MFHGIAFAMVLEQLIQFPMILSMQVQIFKAIMGLKSEQEIGTNLVDNLGVKIRDTSAFTGSTDLSQVEKTLPQENDAKSTV